MTEGDRTLSVFIEGEPIAQGRPRLATIAGRARAYDPKKSREAKGVLRVAMSAAVDAHPIYGELPQGERPMPFAEGPLDVLIIACLPCPKSDFRKRLPAPLRWRAKKPDVENLAKTVMDAATGVFWTDDSQVAKLTVRKLTAAQTMAPFTEVIVRPLHERVAHEDNP